MFIIHGMPSSRPLVTSAHRQPGCKAAELPSSVSHCQTPVPAWSLESLLDQWREFVPGLAQGDSLQHLQALSHARDGWLNPSSKPSLGWVPRANWSFYPLCSLMAGKGVGPISMADLCTVFLCA